MIFEDLCLEIKKEFNNLYKDDIKCHKLLKCYSL